MTTSEEDGFTALVQRQSRFVFRVAYAVLLNSADAEDVVQETFLKLYRNDGWKQLENERAFLARVTWRVAVDRRRSIGSIAEAAELPEAAAPGLDPEQTLVTAHQHAAVHRLIDTLPEDLRLPLVLSANDELNSREIASVLNIPEGTVRTRLQRARLLLRQKLATLQKARRDEIHPQETTRHG